MDLTWESWISVSEGSSTSGAPIAAVPWGDSFALFLSDPNGGIYGIKATPGYGWEIVPGHSSKPGAQITALVSGSHFVLFMADANGEVFTTTGAPYQGWQPWTSVSQGSTTPGAPIAALPWGNSFALFLSDPKGGIYGIKATPGFGWEVVPGLTSKPGAPIAALISGNLFTLFMADVNGEVFTTTGAPYQGWQPWTSVAQGSTVSGAPVSALSWDNSFALFLSDPKGGIYGIKATPGFGWEIVPGRTCEPGGRVAVVPWYRPATAAGINFTEPQFLLFMIDVNGAISFTSGRPYQGWDAWTNVSGVSGVSGAPVTALTQASSSSPFHIFVADSSGEVREARTSDPPAAPSLVVTSITSQTISVSWSLSDPTPVEVDGFELTISSTTNNSTQSKLSNQGQTARTLLWSGLSSGVLYTIKITAFNANGYSLFSTVTATTTPIVTPTRAITVTSSGPPAEKMVTVKGAAFTPNSIIVIKITPKNLAGQIQFHTTSTADGTFVATQNFTCSGGIELTATAYEDSNPTGTLVAAPDFAC